MPDYRQEAEQLAARLRDHEGCHDSHVYAAADMLDSLCGTIRRHEARISIRDEEIIKLHQELDILIDEKERLRAAVKDPDVLYDVDEKDKLGRYVAELQANIELLLEQKESWEPRWNEETIKRDKEIARLTEENATLLKERDSGKFSGINLELADRCRSAEEENRILKHGMEIIKQKHQHLQHLQHYNKCLQEERDMCIKSAVESEIIVKARHKEEIERLKEAQDAGGN